MPKQPRVREIRLNEGAMAVDSDQTAEYILDIVNGLKLLALRGGLAQVADALEIARHHTTAHLEERKHETPLN